MKKFSIEFKWAIIFGCAALIWMFAEKMAGLHDEHIGKQLILTNLFAIVAVVIFVFALKDKKNNYYNGNMDWQRGFLCGVVISILYACLNPIVQYITYQFISPEYFRNMIDYRVSQKYQSLADAQNYFNLKNFLYKDAMPGLSMGVVTSSVVALFVKTKSK